MGVIKLLPPNVAALIAAGEVVERPSSVIKELIENSIDAGARTIIVEISGGGIAFMRVADDGCGISPEDVPDAFCRHSTSKISCGEDLESILTLGFRGEALHSIAAVSRLEMLTARRGDEEGVRAVVEGGELLEVLPAGCPAGTAITVRDLFFNTPARMKFLKKDSTEAGNIEDVLRRAALGRPDISFKFINTGKEIFFTPGDNSLKNAVFAIYGGDTARLMIPAEYEENGIKVSGLIGKAELSRSNRLMQTFFVNGRCVINKNFYFALAEGYKSHMMAGRFPVAVLNIELNPALCDVNVHPSKAEIKFANDKDVFSAVYWAAKNALHNVREMRELNLSDTKITPHSAPPPFVEKQKLKKPAVYNSGLPERGPAHFESRHAFAVSEPQVIKKPEIPTPHEIHAGGVQETYAKESDSSVLILGQLFDTYIVAQYGDNLILADQHAAHERLIYERLRKTDAAPPTSQTLLIPETAELTAAEFGTFQENHDFFEAIGFDIDEFGHNTVRITMLPEGVELADIGRVVSEILETLGSGREKTSSLRDKALYKLACAAALKAGRRLSVREQEELIKKIMELEGEATCPHGRPVILKLTKAQIEKQFRRIV